MEENPRKKLKLGFSSVEKTASRVEEFPDNEDEGCVEKYKPPVSKNARNTTKNSKFCLDISLEEDEKLLDDSGIDLQYCKETGEEKSFEIRRISVSVAVGGDREGPPTGDKPEAESNSSCKHSCSRGETPETNEGCEGKPGDASPGVVVVVPGAKKTPDKSLFRKVQEKLMYECSLTPKKVKKKCLELKMDL